MVDADRIATGHRKRLGIPDVQDTRGVAGGIDDRYPKAVCALVPEVDLVW